MKNLLDSLNNGQVIIIQTDTVYGFAALPEHQAAIYQLKQRDPAKPLINMITKIEQINDFNIPLNDYQKSIAHKYWPGATTLIFNQTSFRIPDSPALRQFLDQVGKPLVTTSANISGTPPVRNLDELKKQFPTLEAFTSPDPMSHNPSQIYQVNQDSLIQIR